MNTSFELNVRKYGGVVLDAEEAETLQLPPKYAVYEKVDTLRFKAEVEKTFNRIRWNEQFNEQASESTSEGNENGATPSQANFFDEETNAFDGKSIQNNSLPFRKRVGIPECAKATTEAKLTLCKQRLEDIVKEYSECDKNGHKNLTREQRKGLEKLKSRIKKKEIICYQTDKSGAMSVDSPENYVESMQPHLEGTIPSDQEEYERCEKLLNAHMKSWSRIMDFDKKVSNNFQAVNNEIPPLYGLRKDHKEIPPGEEEKGPPQRPVCGAVVASNYRISHFISSVIQPIIGKAKHPCSSTEDMLSRVSEVNKDVDLSNCIIGSMDVKALYPSIDIDFAVDKCVEMIVGSEVEFKNVNVDELGLYLVLSLNEETLTREKLNEYCPKRRTKGGRHPTITGCGTEENEKIRWNSWNKREKTPDETELKRMVSFALGVAMKTTLKNHVFKFHDEIRKQATGGAIGVKAAGDIAGLFMTWWDKTFIEKVNEELLKLNLYLRYVDDEYIICEAIPESEDNRDQQKDERTMKRLQEIGNAIHPSIQLTIDFPSNHENGRMPVLDTEQWVEAVEVDGVVKPQVLHSHYAKPMSNRFLVHKDSAMSSRSKENILVADLTRVMRNVSIQCTNEERVEKVQEFICRMQYSGYSKEERVDVYRRAKKKYDNRVRKDIEGTEPLYRSKSWNRKERNKVKESKKKSWFRDDGSEAVLFVSATKDGELADKCRREFRRANLKVKVVERTGNSLKKSLVKSNPFKRSGCTKPTCDVCALDSGIDCKTREVVYRISCAGVNQESVPCSEIDYEGETSRSIGERFQEHVYVMKNGRIQIRKKSFLFDHMEEEHGGVTPPLKLEIVSRCPGDPGLRQATEAVSIRENKPCLNGKDEWTNEPRKRKDDRERR